jgi:hypothetical protein
MIGICEYSKMEETLKMLKSHLLTYRALDDDLKKINAKAYDLRRERKDVEVEMSTILSSPAFEQYNKLEIKEDGSLVKIQRPGTWTKGWTISKNELEQGLNSYFEKHEDTANAQECFDFLVERQKPKMIMNEFSFERSVPSSPPPKKMRM